jgi:hypothetical protein
MAFKLVIEPEAQFEIEEAIEWYESIQAGLGLEFYNYLDGYFKTLQDATAFFSIKRKPVFRELSLKRFPYVIIYEQTKTIIYVYAVFNTHRNPIKKRR